MEKFNKNILSDAINQVTFRKGIFGVGTKDGERIFAAIEKAEIEIECNPTISFSDGILTFVSRSSGKRRVITKFGCHESCECKNAISYHIAIYWILEVYTELMPVVENLDLAKTEKVCKNCKTRAANHTGLCFQCEQNNSPYFSGGFRQERKTETLGKVRF